MRVTGTAQRAAWIARSTPPVEHLAADVWSVPVPIPDNPLRYTLTYLIAAGDELIVVDPGWEAGISWDALRAGLLAAGATPARVSGIVVTHVHPDHHGLSARLRAESGAWIAMHPAERDSLPGVVLRDRPAAAFRALDLDWLAASGVPPAEVAELAVPGAAVAKFGRMAEPDLLLEDGDLVPVTGRRIRAIWTPGHSPGHLCLHDEAADLLLTGDHVLPRISPNIGTQPHTPEPPLAAYLESLRRMAAYDSAEILPAHEYRFRGLAGRVRILAEHHERRCQEIIAILARLGEATAWQVAVELTWSRGWAAVTGFMRRAALAESAAHLEYLSGSRRIAEKPAGPPGSGEPALYLPA